MKVTSLAGFLALAMLPSKETQFVLTKVSFLLVYKKVVQDTTFDLRCHMPTKTKQKCRTLAIKCIDLKFLRDVLSFTHYETKLKNDMYWMGS